MSTDVRRVQFDFTSRDHGVSRDMDQIGDKAEGLHGRFGKLGQTGGAAMGGLTKGVGMLTGALAAAGVGLATFSAALSKGLDAEAATSKMQAQLGLTKTEAGRIGKDAGKIYAQAYGESMDDVKASITSVIRNMDGMKNASSADLQTTTKRAMDLATVMGEEVGPVTMSVSQMMRTGLAKNSKEAFDILTVGAQQGANKAEDLLDTFNEYGTQFRKLGLDGKTAMGIISQGLKAGARDADIVADAMKEFSIRAVDGSASTADGFKKLGLDAQSMAQMIARGGPTASKGLDMVLDRLRKVKDPVRQAAIATELFGTQSEDLGKALFALDPSSAVKGMGQLAGATDRAGAALGDNAKAKITAFKRTLEVGVTNFIGAKVIPAFAKLGGAIQAWGKSKDGQRFLTELRTRLKAVGDWIQTKGIPALRDLGNWFGKKIMPVIVKFHREVLKELISQLKGVGKALFQSDIDWKKVFKVIGKVAEITYKTLGPTLTFLAKVVLKTLGWWIRSSIKSYELMYNEIVRSIKIYNRSKDTIQGWYKSVAKAVGAFKDFSVKAFLTVSKIFLDMVGYLVRGAAKAFGWIPGLGPKLKTAARQFEGFRSAANKEISKIDDGKTVSIRVKAIAGGVVDAGSAAARRAFGAYKGGPVPKLWAGATEAYDSQPVLARVNEHIITPEEVRGAGGHGAIFRLRAMMKKGLLKGYQDGGPVGVNVRTLASSPHATFSKIEEGIGNILVKFATKLASMFGGATAVVRAARSMIGYPYSWGGGGKGGPSYGIGRGAGTYGFDCSGLTEYAWWKGAKVSIGGVTDPQWANSRPISGPRPGALAFPSGPSVHVMLGSDKPGYVIQAPFTGSYVQEVQRTSSNWRWPIGAKYYAGGPVRRAGDMFTTGKGLRGFAAEVKGLGLAGDAGRLARRGVGGPVSAGLPYLVGDYGPEVMVPGPTGGTVHRAGSTVMTVIQNIHNEIKVDPTTDLRKVGQALEEARRAYLRNGGRSAG